MLKSKLDPELIKEIKRLSFSTKKNASAALMGSYRSAFRGKGIEFEEVREYQPGDEIRSIDWKVTARSGHPYVKSYREERDLTVMIAVDVSASTLASTKGKTRGELIARVGAVLTRVPALRLRARTPSSTSSRIARFTVARAQPNSLAS